METRYAADPVRFSRMTTDELRKTFLIGSLFEPDRIPLVYSDIDRAIVGSAVPATRALPLDCPAELRAAFFAERREIGVINVGGRGAVTVDGRTHAMDNRDGLYIGRGSRSVAFSSEAPGAPAAFYILSYPAHREYPTVAVRKAEAESATLGSGAECNRRVLRRYIHPGGVPSCQLVMGFTELEEGSVWNTMPPHTHARRMEVYLYFDVADDQAVFHLMGPPEETRHLVIRNRQAVLSPSWSLHSGVGTRRYAFVWGMGGENQAFDDMDAVGVPRLL
jgi:4-deoxy-L-threo-5-hexosulose-uronate ketol-isomerase